MEERNLQAIDGATLMGLHLEPTRFCVDTLLPQGVCFLGGASKIGKSWMVLDWCVRIAKGEPVWGLPTQKASRAPGCPAWHWFWGPRPPAPDNRYKQGAKRERRRHMAKPRKRNQTLTVRLTEQEKERIQTQAKKARRSVTDYLVALSWETPICLGPDTRPLLVELKRMGSNVNQIAQKVNAGAFTSYNFQEVVDQLGALHEALCRLTRSSPWQR